MGRRPRRWTRWLAVLALVVAAAGLGLRILVDRLTDLDRRLPEIVRAVEKETGLAIEVEGAKLALGPSVAILVRGIRASPPTGGEPILQAGSLRVILRLGSLLRRRPVFDRIEIRSPTFRVERDASGRFNFEEPFARFLAYRPPDDRAQVPGLEPPRPGAWPETTSSPGGPAGVEGFLPVVAVDSLRVRKGRVIFRDAAVEPPVELELRGLDLSTARYPEAGSLRFVLSAGLKQKGSGPARIESSGHFTNIYAAPSFGAVRVAAHLTVRDLSPGHALPSLLPPRLFRGAGGTVDLAADYEGSLASPFTVRAQARFAALSLDAPALWTAPMEVGDGSLRVRVERAAGSLAFEDLAFETARGIAIEGRVALEDLGGTDPILALSLRTPLMGLGEVVRVFPHGVLTAPFWKYITSVVDRGRGGIDSFEGRAALSRFSRIHEPGNVSILEARMRFEDVGGVPGEGFRRLDAVSGDLLLQDGTVHLTGFSADCDRSKLERIEGEVERVYERDPKMTLRIHGDVDLGNLREAFAVPYLPEEVRRVADSIEARSGRGRLETRVTTDFGDLVDWDGAVEVQKGGILVEPWGLEVEGLAGRVDVDRSRISTLRLAGRIHGAEIVLSGRVAPYLHAPALDLDLRSSGIPAAALYAFLGREPPGGGAGGGTVGGALSIRGPATHPADLGVEGSLEIAHVPLGWGDRGERLEDATGKVRLGEEETSFELDRIVYRGVPFRASGRHRRRGGEPSLEVVASSDSEVDLDALLSGPSGGAGPDGAGGDEPPHPGEEGRTTRRRDGTRVSARLSLARAKLAGARLENLEADLGLEPDVLALRSVKGKLGGGRFALAGSARRDGEGASVLEIPLVDVSDVEANALLEALGVRGQDVGGTAEVAGSIRMRGRTREERVASLEGSLEISLRDGAIRRSEVLWKILDFVDVGSWLKRPFDFRLEGLHYSRVHATVDLADGVAHTEDLELEGEPVNLEIVGDLDLRTNETRWLVAVKPFGLVDTVLDRIPIAERIKNGLSLTRYNFAVTGPIAEPRIVPAALDKVDELLGGLLRGASAASRPGRSEPGSAPALSPLPD